MGVLKALKQWIGFPYGKPIPFDANSKNTYNNDFKDGFWLLSTPKEFIPWEITYDKLLNSDFGYVEDNIFFFNYPINLANTILENVSVPLKICEHIYRKDMYVRHYDFYLIDNNFDNLFQAIERLSNYSIDKISIDKFNGVINCYGIFIKKHSGYSNKFFIKNYRTYHHFSDISDYERKLSLNKIIYLDFKFYISTINDPYGNIFLSNSSDFCPYVKNTPNAIFVSQNPYKNALWQDDKNQIIGISDKSQSIIIPIAHIQEFWTMSASYEFDRYQDISYFCLMIRTKENKNYQIFQHSEQSLVIEVCNKLNDLVLQY